MRHDFDPLNAEFLADPFAVLAGVREQPVFYAPSLDYHVVTRHADIAEVFRDVVTYSAAAAQLPLVTLEAEAARILLDGGHRPQPSMVSLDQPAHTRRPGRSRRRGSGRWRRRSRRGSMRCSTWSPVRAGSTFSRRCVSHFRPTRSSR